MRDGKRLTTGTGEADPTDSPAHADTVAIGPDGDRLLGPDAVTILATEHWSLLTTRSLIWNDAMSRTTVFLTVLSASIIALALLADATGFGSHTTTVALVLLPVVLLLGIATYARLVQINLEEFQLTLAMNRLRHAYLQMAPSLEPYFTTGHHDDERGLMQTYMLLRPGKRRLWAYLLVNTPTIVATVDAALAAAIVVLISESTEAPPLAVVTLGALGFLMVWGVLFPMQWYTVSSMRSRPRFPTPPGEVPDRS